MKQAILFPFTVTEDNEERYAAAQKAAQTNELPLVYFTTIPANSEEMAMNEVYLYLLQLKGKYQATHNAWMEKAPTGTKVVIKKGNLKKQLPLFMAQSKELLTVFT